MSLVFIAHSIDGSYLVTGPKRESVIHDGSFRASGSREKVAGIDCGCRQNPCVKDLSFCCVDSVSFDV